MLLASLFAAGLALVLLPGVLVRFARHLEPSEWAGICRFALVIGTASVEVALIGQAAPTVLRFGGVTPLADACEKLVGSWVPGDPVYGWVAAGFALALPVLATIGWLRTRRTWGRVHIEAGLGRRARHGDIEVAVIPTSTPIAYGVHYRGRDQIVMSDGLLVELTGAQTDAVLRHEEAHLALAHHRFLLAGAAVEHAFARIAPVRRSVAAMRAGLERWADEKACGSSHAQRRDLADALLGVALVGISDSVTALWGSSGISDRVEALESERQTVGVLCRATAYAPFVAVAVPGTAALGSWLGELSNVLVVAACPLS
ncbi:MAG: M48 family metalloprotease [Actinobacteria bacterium]|nr:M48 family metalloprotease [Actinomycetota bacterium]